MSFLTGFLSCWLCMAAGVAIGFVLCALVSAND